MPDRGLRDRLPTTATAPFCPSEVQGSVQVPAGLPLLARLKYFLGPGLLVSVGYMDPGNWATDIGAGSAFGHALLFVVVLSSLAAMVLQCLAMRLGIAGGVDLAQACRARYPRPAWLTLWGLAELAIVACDLAEVLGAALAIKLLFHIPLAWGVALTAFDLVIVLGLQGQGFRRVEAIIAGLVATIGLCFLVELWLVRPDLAAVASGLVPRTEPWGQTQAWVLAIGIVGATVMPHNLYLHSSIVQTRAVGSGTDAKRKAIGAARIDTLASLSIAMLVNAAILILAAAAFHGHGQHAVDDIEQAHRLLAPIVGTAAAGTVFAIALLAAGQSSTFTGTIAGQVVMEGFLKLRIPCWQRRVITRGLALIPALGGVLLLGDHAIGTLLVASQVVLSLQLPFAMAPLIRLTSDAAVMGADLRNSRLTTALAWLLFAAISAADVAALGFLLRG